jgi:transcriptional regulator with XRE-family HTH domain
VLARLATHRLSLASPDTLRQAVCGHFAGNLAAASVDGLHAHLDISAQKLGKYERGQDRMRARHIFLAAKYLGVSVGYFFRGAAAANDDRAAGKERSGHTRITAYAGILCDPELGGAVGADRAREARERRGPFRSLGLGQRPHAERKLERVKGIGPSTRSLGSYCSTTELHPPRQEGLAWRKAAP